MMRALVTILLACGLAAAGCSSSSNASDGGDLGDADFAAQVAGSYYLNVSHEGFPDVPAMVTITRDGGFLSSDASDFGARDLSTLNTPVYGSWKRVGDRSVKARTLYFGFDDDGEPLAVTRSTGTFDFDEGLQNGTGQMLVELFDPTQDPLDETEEPFNTLNATVVARRIVVP